MEPRAAGVGGWQENRRRAGPIRARTSPTGSAGCRGAATATPGGRWARAAAGERRRRRAERPGARLATSANSAKCAGWTEHPLEYAEVFGGIPRVAADSIRPVRLRRPFRASLRPPRRRDQRHHARLHRRRQRRPRRDHGPQIGVGIHERIARIRAECAGFCAAPDSGIRANPR